MVARTKKPAASSGRAKQAAKSGKPMPDCALGFDDIPELTDTELRRARCVKLSVVVAARQLGYITKTVSVRELRQHLGSWLKQVAAGTQLVIQNRSRPVARIVPEPAIQEVSAERYPLRGSVRWVRGEFDGLFADRTPVEGMGAGERG